MIAFYTQCKEIKNQIRMKWKDPKIHLHNSLVCRLPVTKSEWLRLVITSQMRYYEVVMQQTHHQDCAGGWGGRNTMFRKCNQIVAKMEKHHPDPPVFFLFFTIHPLNTGPRTLHLASLYGNGNNINLHK